MNTEIIITPVANGWTVTIPSLYNQTDEQMQIMMSVVEKIQGGGLPETEKPKPEMKRNTCVFIFDDFSKVLAFLAKQIKD